MLIDIEVTKYFNYDPMVTIFYQQKIYLELMIERMWKTSMTSKVKEHIEFHYLLTDIRLCTFIFYGT